MAADTSITAGSIVCWSDAPVATEVDREVVLMSLGRGRCYGLGETGSSVWRRLSAPVRVEDLCSALLQEYRADPTELQRDVLALLGQLHAEGLVKVVS